MRLILLLTIVVVTVVSWVGTCTSWRYQQVSEGVAALEPRRFERLTLITLGTGGTYENHRRLGPSLGLGFGSRVILVDAGRAVAEALRAGKVPVAQPDLVLLTRLAPENTVGLDDLLLTGWLAPRATPLRVVGPPGTVALTDALRAAHAREIAAQGAQLGLPDAGASYAAEDVGGGWSEEHEGLRVRAAALPGGPTPALAWRVEAGGRSVVVGTTGWGQDALVELARGADVLVHEAIFTDTLEAALAAGARDPDRVRQEASLHTPLDEVGGLAARAGVRQLVLVRLMPPPLWDWQFRRVVGRAFTGRVVVAHDGQEIAP